MPTVNIYQKSQEFEYKIKTLTPSLKKIVAKELSGKDIQLDTNEISVRLIEVKGEGMLAPIEVEINAANFKDRIERQDEICLTIQKYLIDALQTDVKVWLILSELGHSWENT
jgi:hypothetical protein